jgi:hypothetical protein
VEPDEAGAQSRAKATLRRASLSRGGVRLRIPAAVFDSTAVASRSSSRPRVGSSVAVTGNSVSHPEP